MIFKIAPLNIFIINDVLSSLHPNCDIKSHL